jgi:hypothetical protein
MPWANYTTHRLTGIILCANTPNYSLNHEERRRQNKSYNVVGVYLYLISRLAGKKLLIAMPARHHAIVNGGSF